MIGTAEVAAAGRLVVAGALAVAAAAKIVDRRVTAQRMVLLLGRGGRPLAVLLPIVEIVVAVSLLAWWTPVPGLVALGLVAVFTAALVRASRVRVPCPCFGGAASTPPDAREFARNAVLAVAAVAAIGSPVDAGPVGTTLLVFAFGGAVVGSARRPRSSR